MIILGTIMEIGLNKIATNIRTTIKGRGWHPIIFPKTIIKVFLPMIGNTLRIILPHTNNFNSIRSKEADQIPQHHLAQDCIQRVCQVSIHLRDLSIRRYCLKTSIKLPNSQIQMGLQTNFRNIQVALQEMQNWLRLLFFSPLLMRKSSIVFLPSI